MCMHVAINEHAETDTCAHVSYFVYSSMRDCLSFLSIT